MSAFGGHVMAHTHTALRRAAFIGDFGVNPVRWSSYNTSRMLNLTGERPERVQVMRRLLGELGRAFDHGEMWGRGRLPLMLVGHPYGVDDRERAALAELTRFSTLRVSLDDRPSYYGFGTNHVRVELAEVRRPFAKPPSTWKTRKAAHAARRAFAEEFASD